jgi:proteic killer suppression protein
MAARGPGTARAAAPGFVARERSARDLLAVICQTDYYRQMIKTAADRRTAAFLEGDDVPQFRAIEKQAKRRLAILNEASAIGDLMRVKSHRFEALRGDRKGQYSIRINDKWRICFSFDEGDAYDVEIVDYH